MITRGRRATNADLSVPPERLHAEGIELYDVERGGLATYHGPGQLVGYMMLDLRKNKLSPSDLVSAIEQALIAALALVGLSAHQQKGYRGVWVGEKKIASIGIAVQGGISFHGFALNCNPNLSHFDYIIPCGLSQGIMTSASTLLNTTIRPADIKDAVTQALTAQLNISFTPTPYDQLQRELEEWNGCV